MKFSAICTSVDLIHADIKMGERGMKARPMWCGVTFTFFSKLATDTVTIPFELGKVPNIGDKYVIEVTPCK